MAAQRLLRFTVVGPPRGLAAAVAVHAVLVPLCGTRKVASAAADSVSLVNRWRARIHRLGQYGWEKANSTAARDAGSLVHSRKWRMLNCPPATVKVSPSSPPCRVMSICPHCWGRWAIDQWRPIDASLFGPPARGADPARRLVGLALVSRTLAVEAPFKSLLGRPTLPDLLDRRLNAAEDRALALEARLMPPRAAELRKLKNAGVVGGLEVVSVRPVRLSYTSDAAKAFNGWRVEVRQLLVVSSHHLEAFLSDRRAPSGPLARPLATVGSPTRGELAVAVARVCRYPSQLLYGDPLVALAAVRARRGRRMSTRFGRCYGGSGEGSPVLALNETAGQA